MPSDHADQTHNHVQIISMEVDSSNKDESVYRLQIGVTNPWHPNRVDYLSLRRRKLLSTCTFEVFHDSASDSSDRNSQDRKI
ncbi:hypothetical protein K440DRAFT_238804 [Wilcoxina mikolae CBS 423.85]|nr:hypothetical protein K440DRAFT_238804 [Wilcoxina mikolae CBS 423.85]